MSHIPAASQLCYFVTLPIKAEFLAEARQAILDITPATLSEPGCLAFQLHSNPDQDDTLYLYEIFKDQAAFDAHHQMDYTKQVFENYQKWLRDEISFLPLIRHMPET